MEEYIEKINMLIKNNHNLLFHGESNESGSGPCDATSLFSADRFYGRMCGFALSVLQERDPEHYSNENLKGKDDTYLLIMALTVLNDEERNVYNRLISLRKELPSNGSYAESALGVIEGIKVVKEGLDLELLAQYVDIENWTNTSNDTPPFSESYSEIEPDPDPEEDPYLDLYGGDPEPIDEFDFDKEMENLYGGPVEVPE